MEREYYKIDGRIYLKAGSFETTCPDKKSSCYNEEEPFTLHELFDITTEMLTNGSTSTSIYVSDLNHFTRATESEYKKEDDFLTELWANN